MQCLHEGDQACAAVVAWETAIVYMGSNILCAAQHWRLGVRTSQDSRSCTHFYGVTQWRSCSMHLQHANRLSHVRPQATFTLALAFGATCPYHDFPFLLPQSVRQADSTHSSCISTTTFQMSHQEVGLNACLQTSAHIVLQVYLVGCCIVRGRV